MAERTPDWRDRTLRVELFGYGGIPVPCSARILAQSTNRHQKAGECFEADCDWYPHLMGAAFSALNRRLSSGPPVPQEAVRFPRIVPGIAGGLRGHLPGTLFSSEIRAGELLGEDSPDHFFVIGCQTDFIWTTSSSAECGTGPRGSAAPSPPSESSVPLALGGIHHLRKMDEWTGSVHAPATNALRSDSPAWLSTSARGSRSPGRVDRSPAPGRPWPAPWRECFAALRPRTGPRGTGSRRIRRERCSTN